MSSRPLWLPRIVPSLVGMAPEEERVRLRDVFQLLVVVMSIPFVILTLGMPIVLVVQLLLWIGRQF
jgi:hypothetical protein